MPKASKLRQMKASSERALRICVLTFAKSETLVVGVSIFVVASVMMNVAVVS